MVMREEINKLGREGVPFLFVIDFEMEKPLLFPLDEINRDHIKYTIGEKTNTPEKETIPGNISFSKRPYPFNNIKKPLTMYCNTCVYGNSYLVQPDISYTDRM